MAAFTSPKKTRWMQPCMNATRPRGAPLARVTSGRRAIAARALHRRRELQQRAQLGHAAEPRDELLADAEALLEGEHRRQRRAAGRDG